MSQCFTKDPERCLAQGLEVLGYISGALKAPTGGSSHCASQGRKAHLGQKKNHALLGPTGRFLHPISGLGRRGVTGTGKGS